MAEVTIIGIALAKRSFQLHGSRADGSVAFRKKLSREKVLGFMALQPRCVVAMEACGSAHYWGREIGKLGHGVKLVPPVYVKPFVKRQKNDAADAEAICEAASRPTMRFVAVKTEEQQARVMLFRTRELLVRQRTQTINALRGHLAEFGVVAPRGPAHVGRLAAAIEAADSGLPDPVRELGALLLGQVAALDERIAGLENALRAPAREDPQAVRLMSIPGIGPLSAMAIQAFAPPLESFRRGRDFAAWLGLVPRQNSTGGKPKLGRISKMGQRDLRRLLVIGAMATVGWAVRHGATNDPWLARPAGAQAAPAGRGGAGQPAGAHRLGAADEERTLPGSGPRRLSRKVSVALSVGKANRSEDGMGKRSTRRGRENQVWTQCLRAHMADFGLDPRISIQARGAGYAATDEAGHTRAPDRLQRTIRRNAVS